jgi:hypothetical protein
VKLASRLVSTLGLLALVAGIMLFYENDGQGETRLRWDLLGLCTCLAIAFFLLATVLARRAAASSDDE